jgi:hypothetical protein
MRYLAALLLLLAVGPTAAASDCTRTSVGLTPLTALGTRTYHGYRGGLYPGGRNVPSHAYLAKGLAAAKGVHGKVVLLTVGMSNTNLESQAFAQLARGRTPVTIVNGAQGGQDALAIEDANAPYWAYVEGQLTRAGATDADVQAVWLKEAIAGESEPFPQDAQRLRAALRRIVADLAAKFPSLKLVYVSSRIYAGYATTRLNPEPAAYDSGFAVKWLVGDRVDGKLGGPWIGWGPYLWGDGTSPRKDGLTWSCDELRDDGTHPSPAGAQKVARLLLDFFETSPTTRTWFGG